MNLTFSDGTLKYLNNVEEHREHHTVFPSAHILNNEAPAVLEGQRLSGAALCWGNPNDQTQPITCPTSPLPSLALGNSSPLCIWSDS